MPHVRRTAQAEEDLIDIWLYIAQDTPDAADRLLDEIEDKCALLAANPQLGPPRPDIAEACRYFPVGRYLILYRVIPNGIGVVRVVQGSRRLENLFPWYAFTGGRGKWALAKPGEIGLTPVERTAERIDQDTKTRLPPLTAGLTKRP